MEKEKKQEIISQYRVRENDSGSTNSGSVTYRADKSVDGAS